MAWWHRLSDKFRNERKHLEPQEAKGGDYPRKWQITTKDALSIPAGETKETLAEHQRSTHEK